MALQQLSPQDAQFLYMETGNNLTHVVGVSIYDPSTAPDGHVRFKEIIEHVRSRLHTSPVFKRRLAHVPFELDYPYWVEDEYFDLEHHIRHGRLPEPADWRQFCIHIARYHSRPMDMQRPLWEMYVIEGLDNLPNLPKGCYAIATKIHHCAIDGASAMRFFSALGDIDPLGTPAVDISDAEQPAGRQPAVPEMFGRAMLNNIKTPVRMADTLMRAVPALYGMAEKILESGGSDKKKTKVPETRFNKVVSPHKMFDATVFSLADFKAISKLVPGAKINDAVLAVCSGALRKYLQHHNELPKTSLVGWVPVNARPKNVTDEDLLPGNNISAMTAAIHTNVADPIKRLEAIYKTTSVTKEAKSGVSARLMTDLSKHVPAATQVMASRLIIHTGLTARLCNLFVSNVPGPQEPQYMNGARLINSYGLAPLADGMGLFIATPSYNGQIAFNIISTREILPDIEFFMDCLRDSFAELKQAVTDKDKPAPKLAAKAKAKAKPKAKPKPKAKAKTKARAKAAPAKTKAQSASATPDSVAASGEDK